jgi:hypothetical protein
MDIISWIIRRIKLDDPVYPRNIETTSSYVGTQKNTRLCIVELEERIRPFLLFLFSLSEIGMS